MAMRTDICNRSPAIALMMVLIAMLTAGCAGTSTSDTTPKEPAPTPAPPPRLIGGDRDAHGCLAPAGYMWCARERACVRPWELAKQAQFDNTAEGFAAYCSAADSTTTP
jgi:hypothetical protein